MRMLTGNEAAEGGQQGMLSVIIPVLNEVSTIERVIRSVQEVALLKEIIVVDDASTDGTRELLSELAPTSNLKILRHERTRGKGAAIRAALANASGDFVVTVNRSEASPAQGQVSGETCESPRSPERYLDTTNCVADCAVHHPVSPFSASR